MVIRSLNCDCEDVVVVVAVVVVVVDDELTMMMKTMTTNTTTTTTTTRRRRRKRTTTTTTTTMTTTTTTHIGLDPHIKATRDVFFVSRHGTIAVHATGYLRCYSLSARAFEASAAAASAVAASAPAVAAQFVFLLLQPKRKRPTLVHRMPFPVRLARFRCR